MPPQENDPYKIFAIVFIIFFILGIIVYFYFSSIYYSTTGKHSAINKINEDITITQPICSNGTCIYDKNNCILKNFYVKSAYNCCLPGGFYKTFTDTSDNKNSSYNFDALRSCIYQGARFLDFEIFSIDNKPVIAASNVNSNLSKGTYNYLNFDDTMREIAEIAFSDASCNNNTDPLFLHFRISSEYSSYCRSIDDCTNNIYVGDITSSDAGGMAGSILKHFGPTSTKGYKLLGPEFGYLGAGSPDGNIPDLGSNNLKDFLNKVVIMVYQPSGLFKKSIATKFYELVNIESGSQVCNLWRMSEVLNTQDTDFVETTKKTLTIVLPDYSNYNNNPTTLAYFQNGVQFGCMSFTNHDNNFKTYIKKFNRKEDSLNYAFKLKDCETKEDCQLFIPITFTAPKPPNPEYSYAKRNMSTDYYSFDY